MIERPGYLNQLIRKKENGLIGVEQFLRDDTFMRGIITPVSDSPELTDREKKVLSCLWENGTLSIENLADELNITQNQLTYSHA